MNLSDLSKGIGWVQNMNRYQNTWETRDGFGVIGIYDTQMLVKAPVPQNNTTKGSQEIGFTEVCGTFSFRTDFGHEQVITVLKTKGNTGILTHDYPDFVSVPESSAALETSYYSVIVYDATTEEYLEEPLYRKTTELTTELDLIYDTKIVNIPSYPVSPTPAEYITSISGVGNQHGAQETSYIPYQNYAVLKDNITTPVELMRDYDLKDPPSIFFFHFQDKVFFGTRDLGVYYYSPTIFRDERLKRAENMMTKTQSSGYSESALIKKLVFKQSVSTADITKGYAYFRDSEMPVIVDATVWNDRVAFLGQDKAIYYSQPNEPYAIITDDFDVLTTELTVASLSEINGRIMAFTNNEAFLIQPIEGQVLASGGRVLNVSSTIGCPMPAGKVKQKGTLWWVDHNGVHTSGGSGDITTISEPAIDKFFKTYIENPFTNYYTNNGWTTLDKQEQPSLDYRYMDLGVQALWDDKRKHVVFNFTELRIAIVFSTDTKQWYLWNFESVVALNDADEPTVGASHLLNKFWLSSIGDRLFGVFTDKQDIVDETYTFDDTTNHPTGKQAFGSYISFPFYVTEYGRGGSLDRSNILAEERRKISSGYVLIYEGEAPTATAVAPTIYFEKGYWREAPFATPKGTAYTTNATSESDAIYWLPISIQMPNDATPFFPPDFIAIDFRFDKNHWRPVTYNINDLFQLDFDLPNERTAVADGFGFTNPVAGTAEVSLYDSVTGLPNDAGDEIRIRWSGAACAPYTFQPYMNIVSYDKNHLIYLPFRRYTGSADNALSLGITLCIDPPSILGGSGMFIAQTTDGRYPYELACNAYAWMETYTYPTLKQGIHNMYGGSNLEAAQTDDKNVQSVDWLYKTIEVGDGKVGLKPRGTIAQMSSRGSASAKIKEGWSLGLYNILVSTNYKQYQGQIIDYSTSQLIGGVLTKTVTPANMLTNNKETNIESITVLSNDDFIKKNFNENITLGDVNDSTVGNYIVDSEIFVNKVTSDGTRGERFSYTFFGHVRNKAEKLYFKSIDAIYKVIGSVRRTGR